MTAMEKVAWTEFLIAVTAAVAGAVAIPWLGNAALGFFGLLGFVVCGSLFLRGSRSRPVVDERDQAIERQAIFIGMLVAWMTLFLGLLATVLWAGGRPAQSVSTTPLIWLLWGQFAISYAVKGGVAILFYRSQRHAS
jgi:hypothetical protein